MTAGDPPAADIAGPTERYEQLRARALAGQPDGFRLGLAVLRRGGVANWLQASGTAGSDTGRPRPARSAVPVDGRADEVVAVLAAMALACAGG